MEDIRIERYLLIKILIGEKVKKKKIEWKRYLKKRYLKKDIKKKKC